jgi:hypothetical protein
MKLAEELIRFGEQLAAERDAAHDLWTWLPSHKIAEKHHGDHASEFSPSNRDVMAEAALYLAHLTRPDEPLTPEEQDWFTRCPCDETHEEDKP